MDSRKSKPKSPPAEVTREDLFSEYSENDNDSNQPRDSEYLILQRRPPLPSLVKKSKKVLQALNKLDLHQQERDLLNFSFQSRENPSPFKDSCCASFNYEDDFKNNPGDANKNNIEILDPYGPFVSCPAYHSHSLDYFVFPVFNKPLERKIIPLNTYGRPNSATGRPMSDQSQTEGKVGKRCRNCLNFSTFLNTEQLYEEYKSSITYSKAKIGKLYGAKIAEKFEAYQLRGDKPSNASAKNMRDQKLLQSDSEKVGFGPVIRTNLGLSGQGDAMIYGPAAIAHVTGYDFNLKKSRASGLSLAVSRHKRKTNQSPAQKESSVVLKFEIPLPTDNVRYYDDDTDPKITELLANAPLTIHEEFNQSRSQSPSTKVESHAIPVSRSSITKLIESSGSRIASDIKLEPKVFSSSASHKSKRLADNIESKQITETGPGKLYSYKGAKVTKVLKDIKRNSELSPSSVKSFTLEKPSKSRTRITKKGALGITNTNKTKLVKIIKFKNSISMVSLPKPSSKYKMTI